MNEGTQLDSPVNGTLPWPADAVMIVAARKGTETRATMEGVIDATCRMCDAELAADTRTVRTAERMPERNRRPVMFFCVECALKHDRKSVGLLVDQRAGRNDEYRTENA